MRTPEQRAARAAAEKGRRARQRAERNGSGSLSKEGQVVDSKADLHALALHALAVVQQQSATLRVILDRLHAQSLAIANTRARVASRLRALVIERDGGLCKICGQQVDPENIHIDHVIPISRGGKTVFDNLRVTHPRCNLRKGSQ